MVISLFENAGFFTIDLGALATGGAVQQLGAAFRGESDPGVRRRTLIDGR
jgi:predicted dinucleotide-binding enzyme